MINNLPKWILSGAALLHMALLLIVVFSCIGYPYSFDWAEGGMVDQARWVLSGKPLYAKPSLEFTSFMYQPLYIYVSALAIHLLGVGLWPLRLISFIASAGIFYIIYLFVRRETGDAYYGILACGLFAACYILLTGSPLNMARVDQLFLFLLIAAAYLVRFYPSRTGYMAAGVLFALSFLTKQTALVAALPILLYAVIAERRKSLYLVVPFVVIAAGSVLLLDHIYNGWYSYYVFKLPGRIPFEPALFAVFLKKDLMAPLSIACVMSLFFVASQLSADKKKGLYYLLLAVGVLCGSWLSRLNSMAFPNVVLPSYCIISILCALGTHKAIEMVRASVQSRGRLVENFTFSVCIIQLALLLYSPLDYIPTKKDLDAGAVFVRMMSQFKGEVFAPYDSYIPILAGKRTYAHYMGLYEQLREGDGPVRADLINEMRQAVYEKRFEAIILDVGIFDDGLITKKDIEQNYDVKQVLNYEGTKYWPSDERVVKFVCVMKRP